MLYIFNSRLHGTVTNTTSLPVMVATSL